MTSRHVYHPSLIDYDDSSWNLWIKVYKDGRYLGYIRYWDSFSHESSACRYAKKHFNAPEINADGKYTYSWSVSKTDPFVTKKKRQIQPKRLCIYCKYSRAGESSSICGECVDHSLWEEVI